MLVAVDKFTKWIEYKPIVKISSDRAVDFSSDIIHRFGFPHTIITYLGSNFTSLSFWDFWDNSCIEVKYVSVAHPRANGQVERINGLVLDGLKKRLYDANSKKGGKWIQELPHVMVAANAAEQGDWTVPLLSHLWVRGYTTRRYHVEISKCRSL